MACAAPLAACGGGSSAAAGSSSSLSPFFDVTLSAPTDLAATARRGGLRSVTLAFITGARSGCKPTWGGEKPLEDAGIRSQVARLRAQGGDVRVSFGGRDGAELAARCSTPRSLARAYQAVVDGYRLRRADFDIEGAALAPGSQIDRRSKAIAELQRGARRRGRPLDVSLTLPADPTGLTPPGLSALRSARRAGVRVDRVNLMAMDYGDEAAPSPAGRMGTYAVQAATRGHAQIGRALKLNPTAAWKHLSVTPMLGINDVPSEVFTLTDARTVARFAHAHGVAVSVWSLSRDRPCPSPTTSAQPDCSGLGDSPLSFVRALGP